MNLHTAAVLTLVIASPLLAQTEEQNPASPPAVQTVPAPPAPARKMRLISDAQTANYIAKFDGVSAGSVSNSILFESNGNLGIGTSAPTQKLHLFANENAGTLMLVENTNTGSGAHAGFRTTSNLAATSYIAHGSRAGTISRFGLALDGWSEIVNFNGNGQIIGTTLATPIVFGTGNAERMRIHADGKVSIGGPNNAGRLNVVGSGDNGYGIWGHQHSGLSASGIQNATGIAFTAGHSIPAGAINSGGVVGGHFGGWNYGPGRTDWATAGLFQAGNLGGTVGTVTNAYGIQSQVLAAGGTVVNGYGVFIHDTQATNDYGVYQFGTDDTNFFAGNVVIGTVPNQAVQMLTVNGNAHFHGT
ncbi:MAG TPA: hypothetical protein VFV49_03930, partial [Thermoanaerobaculia bacterium]|nr:hypothetical protein [Thermoanaerobaculia bacterium]